MEVSINIIGRRISTPGGKSLVIPFPYLDEKNGYPNLLLQKRLRSEKTSPLRI
jgi:hypothetical protein